MRAELIGHFEPCMTEIYLHIDARIHGRLYGHAPVVLTRKLAADDSGVPAARRLLAERGGVSALGTINRPLITMHD